MSELTLTVVRLGLLALLWIFVFSVVGVLRGDLYGTQVTSRERGSRRRRRRDDRSIAQVPPPRGPARETAQPGRLTVVSGPLTGTSVPLGDRPVVIGRAPDCTLVLDDDYASSHHARLYRGPEGWVLEDLGSTNGTYLGSGDPEAAERISDPVFVHVGSTVRIGTCVLELQG